MIRGLLTDDEWAYFEPFLIRRAGRPPRNHRRVMDATFWLMRTGAPWRDLPEEFGNWNSIFRQFRRWADSGIWDVMLEALAGSGLADTTLQMIDATIVRAHHCAPSQVVFAGSTNSLHKRIRPFGYAVGQDGDPRVPVLIRGTASRCHFPP